VDREQGFSTRSAEKSCHEIELQVKSAAAPQSTLAELPLRSTSTGMPRALAVRPRARIARRADCCPRPPHSRQPLTDGYQPQPADRRVDRL
jgi:hypothetical protein